MWTQGPTLDWKMSPLEALLRWTGRRPAILLHSGRLHPRWSRWSLLAEPVGAYQFLAGERGIGGGRWTGPHDAMPPLLRDKAFGDRPFRDLRTLLAAVNDAGAEQAGGGLWVGYLSYDLGRWIERMPTRAAVDRDWPIIELAWCPGYLVHDGLTGTWRSGGSWTGGVPRGVLEAAPCRTEFHAGQPRSVFTRQEHEQAVRKALDYIAAGDVFQVNLAQRFTAEFEGVYPHAQRTMFAKLAAVSPAWYGAYLELPDFESSGAGGQSPRPQRVIASTSPELFLEVDAEGNVITRPIKGTRPASVAAGELLRSEKDIAELNMIVDLLRNDLGRVCSYGSVQVAEARAIESHPTVHHGVATIRGRLHPTKDVVDLLRATLPGGSVTGAPKVRAMEIIDELEPVRRGPYCGCIGVLGRDMTCLNIAIRTMLVEPAQGRVDFSVGGGIVADSQPGGEYEETLHKAQAMLSALLAAAPVAESTR